mmetsp:Transcript_4060/g.10596  ORF Transcript_4060/g.10596 Transcript_4060/m.10596 type:complete len:269 (-) Transcript_4060:1793-2599(-)
MLEARALSAMPRRTRRASICRLSAPVRSPRSQASVARSRICFAITSSRASVDCAAVDVLRVCCADGALLALPAATIAAALCGCGVAADDMARFLAPVAGLGNANAAPGTAAREGEGNAGIVSARTRAAVMRVGGGMGSSSTMTYSESSVEASFVALTEDEDVVTAAIVAASSWLLDDVALAGFIASRMYGCLKNSSNESRSIGERRRSMRSKLTRFGLETFATSAGSTASRDSMFCSRATKLAPPYGGAPDTISNRIAPTLHRSAFAS